MGEVRQKLFPEHAHFHPRQMLTQTHMRAITQRHVTIGFAMNVKFEGIFINVFIAARAGKVYHHPVIGLDVDPAYLHVAYRGSHKMFDR